jgi:hypothetical protein
MLTGDNHAVSKAHAGELGGQRDADLRYGEMFFWGHGC